MKYYRGSSQYSKEDLIRDLSGLRYFLDNPYSRDEIFDRLVRKERGVGGILSSSPDAFPLKPVSCNQRNKEHGGVLKRLTIYTDCDIYLDAEKVFYTKYMLLKSSKANFPDNLVSGWYHDADAFGVHWNFQDKDLIEIIVDEIIETARNFDRKFSSAGAGFAFLGYTFDVPQSDKELYLWNTEGGTRTGVTLQKLAAMGFEKTVEDKDFLAKGSGTLHGKPHDYPTFEAGSIAFFKTLVQRTRIHYPNFKWMVEPARIYNSDLQSGDEWTYRIQNKFAKGEITSEEVATLTPDLLFQEYPRPPSETNVDFLIQGSLSVLIGTLAM